MSKSKNARVGAQDKHRAPETAAGKSEESLEALQVRRVVAGNPNTPRQVLGRLAVDTSPSIRRAVALNPKTPADLLRKLVLDDCSEVRLAAAENPNVGEDVLLGLTEDLNADVRYGVAENPHMPEDVLMRLAADENPYVRCRALKTLQMLAPDVQTRLRLLLQQANLFGKQE